MMIHTPSPSKVIGYRGLSVLHTFLGKGLTESNGLYWIILWFYLWVSAKSTSSIESEFDLPFLSWCYTVSCCRRHHSNTGKTSPQSNTANTTNVAGTPIPTPNRRWSRGEGEMLAAAKTAADDGNSPSPSKVWRCRGLSGLLTIFGKGKLCGLIVWKMVQRKDEHKWKE